jgi:hypothetical protein
MDHHSTVSSASLIPSVRPWLLWVGASLLGTSVAVGITHLLILLAAVVDEDRWAVYVFVPAFSILIGLAQSAVLSRWVRHAFWWVAVSLIGCLLAYASIIALGSLLPSGRLASTATTLIVLGASTGIVQWVMLRQHFPSASLWILASVLGWAILALIIGKAFTQPAELALVGAVPPSVTGALLSWWVHRAGASHL